MKVEENTVVHTETTVVTVFNFFFNSERKMLYKLQATVVLAV